MITNVNKNGTNDLSMVEIDRLLQQKKTTLYLEFNNLLMPYKLVHQS